MSSHSIFISEKKNQGSGIRIGHHHLQWWWWNGKFMLKSWRYKPVGLAANESFQNYQRLCDMSIDNFLINFRHHVMKLKDLNQINVSWIKIFLLKKLKLRIDQRKLKLQSNYIDNSVILCHLVKNAGIKNFGFIKIL